MIKSFLNRGLLGGFKLILGVLILIFAAIPSGLGIIICVDRAVNKLTDVVLRGVVADQHMFFFTIMALILCGLFMWILQFALDNSLFLIDKGHKDILAFQDEMYKGDELDSTYECYDNECDDTLGCNNIHDYKYYYQEITDENIKASNDGNYNFVLPLDIFPDRMGINLCSVKGFSVIEQEDKQLVSVRIDFIPGDDVYTPSEDMEIASES